MMQVGLGQTSLVLADPIRWAMLAQLKLGESSVSDLAKPNNISLPLDGRVSSLLGGEK